ncbi:sulfurtransferase TusA family protein [Leadbettera azotonutricia]|uniref:SirA family protein n=1 Tax=Leadbettera azotonutricia (strain ATCC BAA-888 / DSM 13862 / ZAS-9) TaxID=545695 RepID=F5YCM4_LEAAZ|nr:sulfurtransferase TusA family protein [Leadbettera azotonutricia]AEF80132.1 SirA family protein [Leadbettera azotonutricia ZAS-9]
MSDAQHIDAKVDITTVVCPVTFVKTKVALEELDDGQVLEVRLNAGEPIQNVPRSLKDEGHKVTNVTQSEDGTFLLTVVKGGLSSSAGVN